MPFDHQTDVVEAHFPVRRAGIDVKGLRRLSRVTAKSLVGKWRWIGKPTGFGGWP